MKLLHDEQKCKQSWVDFQQNGIKQQPNINPVQQHPVQQIQEQVPGLNSTLVKFSLQQLAQNATCGFLANFLLDSTSCFPVSIFKIIFFTLVK